MKKKIIILILLIIALISLVLYNTLATDITMKETTGEADLTYNIDINDTDGRTITVEAGKTKVFDIFITNRNGGTINYALVYGPRNIRSPKVFKLNTSKDEASGLIANNTTLQITLMIKNSPTTDITYNILPITGYEKGGDLVIPSGYMKISEEYCLTPSIKIGDVNLTVNGNSPSFSSVATTDEGIYCAKDDYGISYYFRGASTNNYVKFAGYYWRIIRINGDGSIRMIYDGTVAHANGETNIDRVLPCRPFNYDYNDNTYVGYMYGSAGASSYEETHTNINDSSIKKEVDNWYKTNIVDKGYSEKVADVIYCNDRSVSDGTGIGPTETYYKSNERLYKNPVLTCSQKNDAFTVNDMMKGNGALTYPVGLITADEVNMAGAGTSSNNNYYLYTGINDGYWTMGPHFFSGTYAHEYIVNSNGKIDTMTVNNAFGINYRPVISLKSNVEIIGNGTQNSPFEVK